MKSRSKKGEFKKAVKDANKKLKNSVDALEEEERRRLLSLETKEGEILLIRSAKFSELEEGVREWIIDLWDRNMRQLMKDSHWGYDRVEKAAELGASSSRYLVAETIQDQESPAQPVAYCHYRYDMDLGDPVVYCYEMQAEPSHQRQGIGGRFLHLLHIFAKRTTMAKVMATILYTNTNSEKFFKRNGFSEDETNLSPFAVDYMILSRSADSDIPLPSPLKRVRFPDSTDTHQSQD